MRPQSAPYLAPNLDLRGCADLFGRSGRVHVPGFLREEAAASIYQELRSHSSWNTTIVHDSGARDFSVSDLAAMSADERAKLDEVTRAAATHSYVGRYKTWRLSAHGEVPSGLPPALAAVTAFLNGPEFLDFARYVSGDSSIALADAQATCFEAGDFLHPHTDTHPQKQRRLAYVLNLSPEWRPQWGGLLGFIDADQHLSEAYTPAWNALNLLCVDRLHFVSVVAPFAGAPRYSITGWLRAA